MMLNEFSACHFGVDAVEHRFASERHAQVLHREPQIRRAFHKRFVVMVVMVVIMRMVMIVVCVFVVHDAFRLQKRTQKSLNSR